MKASANLFVLCASPLFLLAIATGAEDGSASLRRHLQVAKKNFCYSVVDTADGIQVTPHTGAPPIPASYFASVFPKDAPVPSPSADVVNFQEPTAPVAAPAYAGLGQSTDNGHACVEGSHEIYDGINDKMVTIRCPRSCSGDCYGVKVHTEGCGYNRCLSPFEIGSAGETCGWC